METTQTAIGYCRVSTAGQRDDGVSLAAQRSKIEAWCQVNGYELGEVFVDAGLSGRKAANRPALQDALRAVCRTRGSALVVYSLSRLARSTRDALQISERIDKAGADLVSLSEKIDTTSAAGRMIFRLMSVLAEFESDLTSERTVAALSYKRAKGERISGRIPFGYTLHADGVRLIPNDAELQIVGEIEDWRANGWTLRAIADELQARGIPTRTGTAWSHSTVVSILKRRKAA